MLRTMGNLAERYGDAGRSGVYAVRDPGIPRIAAREADAFLVEMPAARLREDWTRIERDLCGENVRACVVLVPDVPALPASERDAILARLTALAFGSRALGRPLFAVLVDPASQLGLPPLYRESVGR